MNDPHHQPPAPQELSPEFARACLRSLLDSAHERVFVKDHDNRFVLVSAGFLEAVAPGRSLGDVVGKTDFDLFSTPHAARSFEDDRRVLTTGEPIIAQVERETYVDERHDTWVSTTKQPLRNERGEIIGTWGISRDITAQIEAEQALVHQALHDSVTGLANRVALMDRLEQSLVALERRPGRVGLMFVDLDDFKDVNDAFGHDAGDRVLVEVGRRLRGVARRTDTVARLGGDEFVVLLSYLHDDADFVLICDRIANAIRSPLTLGGRDIRVTGSVGIAVTDDPRINPGELLRRSDVAMYGAKRAGRDRFEIFDADAQTPTGGTSLASELAGAIERSELFVLYQPLFQLEDGALRGAEALVRWLHPERGVIVPTGFIPFAEERGVIPQIDTFVLNEACRQLALWTAAGEVPEDFVVSVNVSGRPLRNRGLVDRVESALRRHGVPPDRLCIEITETALVGELGDTNRVLESLSNLGVRLALDDFGTGYSTLAHLQRLRADTLKIGRSFITRLGRDPHDRRIIAAVTAMAHALGMTVVGEGIETDGQLDSLLAADCDEGQGFVFAPPLKASEIAALAASAGTSGAQSVASSHGDERGR